MTELNGIVYFLKVAQTGSFSAAARMLHVTPQAVSSQIHHLETQLGVRLFNRTTRRLSLTDEGHLLKTSAAPGLEAIQGGLQQIRERQGDASGTVRLAVPYGISQVLVVGLLPRFMDLYPRIHIELLVENEALDVIAHGVDVGIIGGSVTMNSLAARRITTFRLLLCASPEYLARHGTPRCVEDLETHRRTNLLNPRTGKITPWTFRRDNELITLDAHSHLTVNDTETHRRAVLNGAGIGQIASFFAAPFIRSQRLQVIPLDYVAEPIPLYLYLPRRSPIPKKNRLLADFLVDELRKHIDFDLEAIALD